ncbi:MAG: LysM peptidoglycan-binding domain-containing protein [Coriobacteriales bacterium]|nr:LysM peptidoglycan-binding domain-containing protein [Coriobacteriales bacterium]
MPLLSFFAERLRRRCRSAFKELANTEKCTDANPDCSVFDSANTKTYGGTVDTAYHTYVVVKGDSLWAIAQKMLGNGARYKEIKALNGLASDTIFAGNKLKIPKR